MRLLFITPYVPSRIRTRPFHIIKELTERHEVYVLALGELAGTKAEGADELMNLVADLRVIPHSKLRGALQALAALPSAAPMCTAFCRSTAMKQAVAEAVSGTRFDVVHVEHLRAAHFAPLGSGLPVVFDSVDCLTGLFAQMSRSRKNPVARLVMMEEAWKLRRYEPLTLARFDRVVITSETERDELLALDSTLVVDVVPNGVDAEYFAPRDAPARARRVVFSGKMSYHPNAQAALWFAEKVFPSLRQQAPDAEFVIVGSDPPSEVRELAKTPGITVTGFVDDLRPYLGSCVAAVVPMQVAVGIQNKILEAMAMGLPVIASPIACRAFGQAAPGIVVADTPEQTLACLLRLLDDPEAAARIGREGRGEVERAFSWEASVARLEGIYEEALAARAGR